MLISTTMSILVHTFDSERIMIASKGLAFVEETDNGIKESWQSPCSCSMNDRWEMCEVPNLFNNEASSNTRPSSGGLISVQTASHRRGLS